MTQQIIDDRPGRAGHARQQTLRAGPPPSGHRLQGCATAREPGLPVHAEDPR